MKLSKPRLRKSISGSWSCRGNDVCWWGDTPQEAFKGWAYTVGAEWLDQYKVPPNGGTPYWCSDTTYQSGETVRFGQDVYTLMYTIEGRVVSSTNDSPNKRGDIWFCLGSYEEYKGFEEVGYSLPARPYEEVELYLSPDYKQTGLVKLINWFKGWWK